jgi:hypothetical protein
VLDRLEFLSINSAVPRCSQSRPNEERGERLCLYLKKKDNDSCAINAASKLIVQKSFRFTRRIAPKSDTNHPTPRA